MSGAQAADLPVKAAPVEYVKICSLYGAGFFYIPGTDTCIKLGGYLRVDTTFNTGTGAYGQPIYSGDAGQYNRYRDYYLARSRMALTVDTRTATEYGVVRTFGQADFQFQNAGTFNPATTVAATFPGGITNAFLSNSGGGYVAVEFVFIQFAGFTFGKSASAYATPWHGYPGNNNSYLMGGHDTVTGVNNIQYTAQFGNGVSASIGLDDPTVFNRTAVANLAIGVPATLTTGNAYGGTRAPDVVGNIRVDQAWGLWQISAAAHEVTASYNSLVSGTAFPCNAFIGGATNSCPFGASETSGHPSDKWGGSVMMALQIKNIPWGAGDDFKIDTSYAKGDTKNVISTSGGTPQFAMFGGASRFGSYQSVAFGVSTDAVFLPVGTPGLAGGTGDLKLTTAYGVRGAYNHNWDPYWSSSLWGSYAGVRYSGNALDITTAKGAVCQTYIFSTRVATFNGVPTVNGGKSADFTCDPSFNIAQVGLTTRWTPVKNLTFSGEVGAFFLDQKFTGTAVLLPTAPKPLAVYEFKDQTSVFLNVRVQRNF
jgi:hypothetical protein